MQRVCTVYVAAADVYTCEVCLLERGAVNICSIEIQVKFCEF